MPLPSHENSRDPIAARSRRAPRTALALLGAAACLGSLTSLSAAETPDDIIEKIYGPQLARVKATPDTKDDLDLAANLVKDATAMQADKGVQIELFRRAMGLALNDSGGAAVAENIASNLIRLKVGTEAEAWQDLLDKAQAALRVRNLGKDDPLLPTYYGWQLQLVRACMEAGNSAAAEKQLAGMVREAQALKMKYTADQAGLLLARVKFENPIVLAAKTAQLKVTGDDAKQNLAAGETVLAQSGDWTQAAPYLVKSLDPKWNLILNLHVMRKTSNRSAANEVLPLPPESPSGAAPDVPLVVPPLPPPKPGTVQAAPPPQVPHDSPTTPTTPNQPLQNQPGNPPAGAPSPAQAGGPGAPGGPAGPGGPTGPGGPGGPGAPGSPAPSDRANMPYQPPPPKGELKLGEPAPGVSRPNQPTPSPGQPGQPNKPGQPPAAPQIGEAALANVPAAPAAVKGADLAAAAQYLVDMASPAKRPSPIGKVTLLREAALLFTQAQNSDSEGLTLAQKLELPSRARTAQQDADKALADLATSFDRSSQLTWVTLSRGNLKTDWSSTDNFQHWKLLENGELQLNGGGWDSTLRSTHANMADFVFECEVQSDDVMTHPMIFFREHFGAPYFVVELGTRTVYLSYVKGLFTDSHLIGKGDADSLPKQWSKLRVVFDGDHYVVAVNGRVLIDIRDPQDISAGPPCLMSLHGTTSFRNLRIRELR